jgi:putrescine aminotransferase
MIGVEFPGRRRGQTGHRRLVHHGVIAAYTLNNATVMRFEPPLIISDAQIEHVVRAFDAAVGEARELLAEFM